VLPEDPLFNIVRRRAAGLCRCPRWVARRRRHCRVARRRRYCRVAGSSAMPGCGTQMV